MLSLTSQLTASLELSLGSGTMRRITGTLFLHIEVSDIMANAERGLARAAEDVTERGFVQSANLAGPSQTVGDRVAQMSRQGDLYNAIGELLSRLGTLRGVMDAVSEVSS